MELSRSLDGESRDWLDGVRAGENTAGAGMPHDRLPFFYSDMFDLGYEAVGEVDSWLATCGRCDGRALTRAGAPAGEELVV